VSPSLGRPTPSREQAAAPPLTVSELSALVRQVLTDTLPTPVRVVGEISNFTYRTHCFFSLKDDGSTLRCVCFASAARKLGFTPTDGMQVVATGRIDYYEAQGQLQLYVDKLEPVGQGLLEMRFRALCQELRELGYFDIERKKPLPVFPRTIAVVTSRSGAALQDVINTTRRRCAGCRLLLFDVRVQGAAAAPEVAAAIDLLSRQGRRLGIDAILLTRGGGSMEDLWAFNERIVADAIHRCTLPIVAAIGHETDTTIAELVADARCATPTQAAMTLVPDRAALEHQLAQLSHRLNLLVRRYVDHQRHRVRAAVNHPAMKRPDRMLQPVRQRLEHLSRRMRLALPHMVMHRRSRLNAAWRRLEAMGPRIVIDVNQRVQVLSRQLHAAGPRVLVEAQRRLESLSRHLESVSPRRVLERGYSLTLSEEGRVLRDAATARSGELITTVLAQGRLISRVESDATPHEAKDVTMTPANLPPRSIRRRKPPPPLNEPTLFT